MFSSHSSKHFSCCPYSRPVCQFSDDIMTISLVDAEKKNLITFEGLLPDASSSFPKAFYRDKHILMQHGLVIWLTYQLWPAFTIFLAPLIWCGRTRSRTQSPIITRIHSKAKIVYLHDLSSDLQVANFTKLLISLPMLKLDINTLFYSPNSRLLICLESFRVLRIYVYM